MKRMIAGWTWEKSYMGDVGCSEAADEYPLCHRGWRVISKIFLGHEPGTPITCQALSGSLLIGEVRVVEEIDVSKREGNAVLIAAGLCELSRRECLDVLGNYGFQAYNESRG